MRRPCRLVDFKLISRLFHEDDLEWLFQFGYEALIRGHSGAPAAAAGIWSCPCTEGVLGAVAWRMLKFLKISYPNGPHATRYEPGPLSIAHICTRHTRFKGETIQLGLKQQFYILQKEEWCVRSLCTGTRKIHQNSTLGSGARAAPQIRVKGGKGAWEEMKGKGIEREWKERGKKRKIQDNMRSK